MSAQRVRQTSSTLSVYTADHTIQTKHSTLVQTLALAQVPTVPRLIRLGEKPLDTKAQADHTHNSERRRVPRVLRHVILNRYQLVVQVLHTKIAIRIA